MGSIECGKEAAKQFTFADGYRNLNHGKTYTTTYSKALLTGNKALLGHTQLRSVK